MASVLDLVKHYQHAIEKYPDDEQKVLKCIDKLFNLKVTVQHLQETGVGRTVNALRKQPGEVGQASRALVKKWKFMVASEESDEETDYQDTTNHNGYGNGKDSDDNSKQAHQTKEERSDRGTTSSKTDKRDSYKETNGNYSGSKRRHQSSGEEEPDVKKSKSYDSSNRDDYKHTDVKVKSEPKSDSEDEESDRSYSDSSESEMSESTVEEVKVKQEKIEQNHKSSKHSSSRNEDRKKESSSKHSHDSKSSKHRTSETKERHSSEKSSSKENSHNSHKSTKDRESNSEKKHKSDHKDKDRKHKEESKSSKHSSSDKRKSSSNTDSSSDKHKNSEKHSSKSEKHRSSSQSHKSENDKHKSSSEKEASSDKHKTKDHSSSSKEKHSSSNKEKSKDRSSSSKEKSNSHKSESKHSSSSSSSDKHKSDKSKDKADDKSDSRSKHKSSSSSHKSSKSTVNTSNEDIPKKKIQASHSEDSNDGIDCGSGASFAEALGMISPAKPKKKSAPLKDSSSPGNADLSPAALLAPTAKLAPLPALEISALPEISPHYKPRPPPRLLPHFTDEEAMSSIISSKNQRTKVYSGNKVIGKIPTLYEMCVHILQEHIDALEYTGGVPYEILKPVIDRATPQQLFLLEHYNPYLMEETDHLWQRFCEKDFRKQQRQEMETWREMYMRCQEEREHKLKSLTENIKIAQEAKKAPIKQTKMAYVDTVVKPPRNIARKQAQHGTAHSASASPAARVASLAQTPGVLRGGARPLPIVSANAFKPKRAPLMAKALQFMRGRKR